MPPDAMAPEEKQKQQEPGYARKALLLHPRADWSRLQSSEHRHERQEDGQEDGAHDRQPVSRRPTRSLDPRLAARPHAAGRATPEAAAPAALLREQRTR